MFYEAQRNMENQKEDEAKIREHDVRRTHETLDPHGRYFSAQDQTGVTGDCAMHCIRNLLETNDVKTEDLHESAQRISKITGDAFDNHEHMGAWWSADTIIFELSKRGYDVDYHHDKDFDFGNPAVIGYIIHVPEEMHFTSVRRSSIKQGFVEVVDSMRGIECMRPRRLALNSKNNNWNVISVKKDIKGGVNEEMVV